MFKDCLPDNDLLHVLSQCCEKYPQEIKQLTTLCLKKFADGFTQQKEATFGFSDKSRRDTGPVLKISDLGEEKFNVLNTVQVHNLGEEHNVGLFSYEISIRGEKDFKAASRKLALNKSNDMIVNPQTNKSYKNFKKAAKGKKVLKINWNLKMLELKEKGYSVKYSKIESHKLQDLEYLKQQSNPDKLKRSRNKHLSLKKKTQQMYIEVRFQKNTSKFLKKDNAIFRLKRDEKTLPMSDYVFNLCLYFDQSRCVGSSSMGDLRNVLNSLKSSTIDSVPQNVEESRYDDKENNEEQFQIGEAVACIWQEDVGYNITWYLGIVDQIVGDKVYVSRMSKSDKQGLSWLFPDEAEIHDTSRDQIIARNIEIRYSMTAMFRGNISRH